MQILLIEDDQSNANFIVDGLRDLDHQVTHCADGVEGLHSAQQGEFDLLIVDRMLPSLDGISIIKTLRNSQQGHLTSVPIIVLSALGEVDHRVEGLQAGADDYLAKPFAFAELSARIEALSRRGKNVQEVTKLQLADLSVDLLSHEVTRAGQSIPMQAREFRLLEYLMRNQDQVLTRTMLLENVWDYHFDPQTNIIDVHISRLRGKIDKEFEPKLLHTVRGAGYMMRIPPEE